MPAKRLPWFRFWIDATTHEKVRQLDDGTFRTWVELLDAAAKQPKRGRFASRASAVLVVRRPAKHISTLVSAKLMDETREGLVMHDWDEWQRWRPEDANDDGTPPDQPPNGRSIDSRTTIDQHTNNSAIRARSAAPASGDTETEEDTETEIPPTATQYPPRRTTVVDDEFKTKLEDDFWEAFGSREAVRDSIDAAMAHRARLKYTDLRAYLRNWVRSDGERSQERRGGRVVPINRQQPPRGESDELPVGRSVGGRTA